MSEFLERSKYTRALIKAGQRPTGWSTARLRDEYFKLEGVQHSTAPAPEPTPEPIPDPAPKKAPKLQAVKAAKEASPMNNDAVQALEVLKAALQQGGGISEARVIDLIKAHSNAPAVLEVRNIATGISVEIRAPHKQFPLVLAVLQARLNAYLFGPAGTGKTTLAKQCAEALALPFYFTGAILQKYELTGFIDARGEYQSTPFRQAFEHGGVFLFDEMDASSAQALIAFNAAIANGVCAFPDAIVEQHKDFCVVAASNTQGNGATGDYVRNKLDKATLDRYQFISIGYDEELETRTAIAMGEALGINNAKLIVASVQNMRKVGASSGALITPRATYAVIRLFAAGVSLDQALELAIFNKLSADQRAQLESI